MAKTNWQKKAEKLEEKNEDLEDRLDCAWEQGKRTGIIIFLILVGAFLTSLILGLFGTFDSPYEELNINEQYLAKSHVLTYYPEFENCSITYSSCACEENFFSPCKAGVKVYCDENLDNRDNLRVEKENKPSEVICFEDITIEELFLQRINYLRN